jgi:hypothetical protein
MPLYTERPITLQAEKVSDLIEQNKVNFKSLPDWVRELVIKKLLVIGLESIHIRTLEGPIFGKRPDYLVEDTLSLDRKAYIVNGKYFEAKYEITNGTMGN